MTDTPSPPPALTVPEAAALADPGAHRGREGRRRQARRAVPGAGRRPGQGARAARGLPGAGQDPGRALVRAGAGARPSPAPSSPPTCCPSDLTGSFIYHQREQEFRFRPGPLFTGLLLADEINRTPPKTQSALLEAMQEHQVTVEGETFALPEPFHVLATANPIEYEGTYPLPEAQLDRFLLRVSFGYPTGQQEYDVVAARLARRREEIRLDPVTDAGGLRAMQEAVESVAVDESVGRYCVALATATRRHADVLTGASPRGSLGLVLTARAFAVLRGRDYVIPEDVKAVARVRAGPPDHGQAGALDDRGVGAPGRRRRPGRGRHARDPRAAGRPVTDWLPTAALRRALVVAALGLVLAVVFGGPVLVVLAAPLRPARRPRARAPAPGDADGPHDRGAPGAARGPGDHQRPAPERGRRPRAGHPSGRAGAVRRPEPGRRRRRRAAPRRRGTRRSG